MPAFLTFDEFNDVLGCTAGMLVFVITSECDDAGVQQGRVVEQAVGQRATVHLLCGAVTPSPKLAWYEGGDVRPLVTSHGSSPDEVLDALQEAQRVAASRPSVAEEKAQEEKKIAETAEMLASERLDQFPPFFRMARSLARDAWVAARRTAEGAPLLLPSDAAAARLDVCVACASFRDDRCVECGCYMIVKAHLAAMVCPLGKW